MATKSHNVLTMKSRKLSSPPRFLLAASLVATLGLGLQAGESKAGTCAVVNIRDNTCSDGWNIVGDKRIDNFVFDPVTGSNDSVDIQALDPLTPGGPNFFQIQYNLFPISGGAGVATSGSFGYKINVLDLTKFLTFAQSNVTGGNLFGGTFTTTASSSKLVAPETLTADSSTNPSTILAFDPFVQDATFTQTWGTTGNGTINSFGLQFAEVIPPPNTGVPGPLPILGAGAALGFSRKMRRRIRLAG